MYIVELNLDDDFTSPFAYHIDEVAHTIRTNLSRALSGKRVDRWSIIGIAITYEEARKICDDAKLHLCNKSGRKFQCSQFGE